MLRVPSTGLGTRLGRLARLPRAAATPPHRMKSQERRDSSPVDPGPRLSMPGAERRFFACRIVWVLAPGGFCVIILRFQLCAARRGARADRGACAVPGADVWSAWRAVWCPALVLRPARWVSRGPTCLLSRLLLGCRAVHIYVACSVMREKMARVCIPHSPRLRLRLKPYP